MATIIKADEARGFDVMRGKKVIAHFDNYAEAWEKAQATRGGYIRYFEKKAEEVK